MMNAADVHKLFVEQFGAKPRVFAAPGRVNLIGEHTDYTGGYVLPIAIDRCTMVAAAPRQDRTVRVHSRSAGETREFSLDDPPEACCNRSWLGYVEGVARNLDDAGVLSNGANMLVDSNVPEGAGLSSSAALEIGVGFALQSLAGHSLDLTELALLAQRAEHTYVGTKCGIMDQMISALGKRHHALLIDCRSLERISVPIDTSDVEIVLCDTRVKHELATSAYNQRRAECERGIALLHAAHPNVTSLRDLTPATFELVESTLPVPIRQRCRHVVHENARTVQAAEAFRRKEFDCAGILMARSHSSLRDDFQVSCSELDTLVEIANQCDGVTGSRMTGGGFGGCTVNLVHRSAVPGFVDMVTRRYYEPHGMKPAVFSTGISQGVHELD